MEYDKTQTGLDDLPPTTMVSLNTTAGRGRISLEMHGSEAVFSELSSTYPLKLLSPRISGVGLVYLITYGGGLVSGDYVSLSVDVGPRANLVLLSQACPAHNIFERESYNIV